MAPLPSFIVAANLKEVLGDVVSSELVESVLDQAQVTFVSNFPPDAWLRWGDSLERVRRVGWPQIRVNTDGDIVLEDDSPVRLLAQDDGLNVRGLQWQFRVVIPAGVLTPAAPMAMRSFWINAGEDGDSINLKDVLPVVATPINGVPVGGSGVVVSIVPGSNITVDDTDPANPIVSASTGGGGTEGDMTKAIYDPGNVENDVFDQDNMVDGATNKNFTAADKDKLDGIEDGADATDIAAGIHASASKATPIDADEIPLIDSASSNVLKKLTWANLKTTLRLIFVGKNELVFNVRDYGALGNGSADDTTPVQNTINAAAAASALSPAAVFFPKGTYLCSAITGASDVELRGTRRTKSIVKVKPGTAATELVDLSGCTGVGVRKLGFEGNDDATCLSGIYVSTSGGSKDLTVSKCGFSNFMPVAQLSSVHAALYVWTAKDVVVKDCTFTNNGRACSMESPDGSVEVSGCKVVASTGRMATGIRTYQSSGVATSAKVRFTDNYVDTADYDLVGDGTDGHGIGIYRVQDVNITGNVCTNSGRGILVSNLGHGAIVSHNQCNYNDDAGIRIEPEITSGSTTVGTDGANRVCNISDNVCHDNAGIGITASYAAGSIVANNVCHDNGEWGIHVDSDRSVVAHNTAFNNYKGGVAPGGGEGSKAGIVNYAGVDCIFIGNVCFDNQTVKTQDYGLSITNDLNPVVIGNDFSGNGIADIDNPSQIAPLKKVTGIADINGNTVIDFAEASSAVNYAQIGNRATGSGPFVAAQGPDTNIDFNVFSKGIGNINLFDGAGNFALQVDNTSPSAVNYTYIQNATTGNPIVLGSWGSDSIVGIDVQTRGAGPATVNGNRIETRDILTLTTTVTLAAVPNHRYVRLLNTSAAATLPTAVGNASEYVLKNITAGTMNVATTSSQTIEGAASPYVLAAGESITVVSTQTNWVIV